MAGEIDIVSAESVLDFVQRIDPAATRLVVSVAPSSASRFQPARDRAHP